MPALGETEKSTGSPKKPRFEVTAVALRDNKAGLMWTLNADIAERTFSWDDAQDFIVRMNMNRYGGYKDWRMPSLDEMQDLIDEVRIRGFDGVSLDKTVAAGLRDLGVRNMRTDSYWTSTTNIYYSAEAWCMSMANGSPSLGDKTLYFSLWPVRSVR